MKGPNSAKGKRVCPARLLAPAAAAMLLAAAFGCNARGAGQVSAIAAESTAKRPKPAARRNQPAIDLQCDAERIRNAPAPFHWSFQKIVPPLTRVDWEADITPLSIAGAVTDSAGTRMIHGIRSDSTSWNTAVAILAGALPASTFALVDDSSAIARAGRGSVDGQDAIEFTIDTARDTAADAALIRSVLGAKGFIKGAAWVDARGCPIRFVLDVAQYYRNGTLHKERYEADATGP